MTFTRAWTIAIMVRLLDRSDGVGGVLLAFAVTAPLWYLTSDPLPAAVKRGLENFAREYRR
jgi:hypothetical protein